MKRMLPMLAAVLIAGCSVNTTRAAPSPSPEASSASSSVAASVPSTTPSAVAGSSPSPPAAPSPSTPEALGQCSDDDLDVTNGEMASANTLRRVVVFFTNTSSHPCTLTGFPGADLITAAGGVLVSVSHTLTANLTICSATISPVD